MPSLKGILFRWMMRFTAPNIDYGTPIPEIREGVDKSAARTSPPEGTHKRDLTVNGIPAQWITPPGETRGVMLYLHGGAYIAGSITSHSNMAAYFADVAGVEALLIDYRLAPEHHFPAALEDAISAYRWLLDEGHRPDEIVMMGDSAGGGLTLATLVSLRDDGDPLPAAAVCLSPWTDLAATGESLRTRANKDPWLKPESVAPGGALYYGEDYPADHPLVSPLYADLSGLPPVFIQVGDHEILLSDATRVAERIEACGGEVQLQVWDGMWHVFQTFTSHMRESREAVAHIGRFVRKHINGGE